MKALLSELWEDYQNNAEEINAFLISFSITLVIGLFSLIAIILIKNQLGY